MRAVVVLELLLVVAYECSQRSLAFNLFSPRTVRCRLIWSDQSQKANGEELCTTGRKHEHHRSRCPSSLEMAMDGGASESFYQGAAVGDFPPETSDLMKSTIESVVGNWRERYSDTLSHFRESPRSPGTAPTLAEYVRRGDFHPQEVIGRLQNLKGLNVENFRRILDEGQQYVMRGVEEGESLQRAIADVFAKVPVERMATSIQSFVTVLQTQGMTQESLQASLRALNMEELGVWYVGALGLVSLVSASTSTVSARRQLESKLSEATATLGKEAEEASLRERALLAEKERMQGQVKELTQATATVAKELKELQAEKAKRDYAVAEMKSELRALQNELKIQKAKEAEIASKLAVAEKRLKSETQLLKSELEAKASVEKALNERISTLQEQLGSNEESFPPPVGKPSSPPKEKVSASKVSSKGKVTSESKSAKQGVFFASVEAPISSPILEPPTIPAPPEKTKSSKKASATTLEAPPTASASSETKKSTKTTSAKSIQVADNVDAEAPKASVGKKAVPKGTTTPKVSVLDESKSERSKGGDVETPTLKKPVEVVEDPMRDWNILSAAALKRKTIAELTLFLESKGLPTIRSDGKPMKKPELVEKVLDAITTRRL